MEPILDLDYLVGADTQSDLHKSARYVKSRLGYDIEVLDKDGGFLKVIKLPDDNNDFVYLQPEYLNFLDNDLKEIAVSYLRYVLERYLSSTVRKKFGFVDLLAREVTNGVELDEFLDALAASSSRTKSAHISAGKEFLKFALLHEYEVNRPGFPRHFPSSGYIASQTPLAIAA
ncbi:hypothetical protein [Pseudomonas sp. PA15(2017)]|uniref:hypothetical protein n=1 Tax=Pseudomonas sp. PA15(2017) TaxID=1932111 RepID=UPI00117A550D|nr:hypothetical protein [Pseudomonas sp. PA15(2017)]